MFKVRYGISSFILGDRYITHYVTSIALQRSYEETQPGPEEYHDTDKRNANYNTSPSHQYPQNNQCYEVGVK